MAAVAPPADQAADLLQKLSLDSQAKTVDVPDATKKPSVDSNKIGNGAQSERSVTPILPDCMDPNLCYLQNGYPSTTYYYGGYDGSEWEEYSRYMNPEGVDMTAGAYGENGSLMYHHGYSYTPYAPYSPATSPVPTFGHDGQLYGAAQHYQYPTPYFQSVPTSGPYPTPAAPTKGEMPTDQAQLSVDTTNNSKSNGIVSNGGAKGSNGTAPARTTYQNSSFNVNNTYGRGALHGGIPASGYQDLRFGFDGLQSSPIPWLENLYFSDGQPRPITSSSMNSSIANGNNVPSSRNQNFRPQMMGLHQPRQMSGMNTAGGYMNRMYPNKFYGGQYGNTYRSGLGYGSSGYDTRSNGRSWMPKGRGNGFYNYGESLDGLNELNRGPRAKSTKNAKGFTPAALAVKGQNNIPLTVSAENEKDKPSATPDWEQYNKPDFPETYSDGKFFIIKSYSEDDVHKSIKYNIWASTPNGNKKLDAAYQAAQQSPGECPVFLFFSVNTSGQFVGVAEMVGPVDFNKNVEYWQQDKWIGCFPVKWHIVKDVPNSLLKHIILENNENKPVTNSRDTQEVKLEQGLQVLKIFKDHSSKQCILDDFDFYEERQKKIQEKKAKQQQFHKQSQVWEGRPTEESKESTNGDVKPQKLPELEAASAVVTNGDIDKNVKPAANGVANSC